MNDTTVQRTSEQTSAATASIIRNRFVGNFLGSFFAAADQSATTGQLKTTASGENSSGVDASVAAVVRSDTEISEPDNSSKAATSPTPSSASGTVVSNGDVVTPAQQSASSNSVDPVVSRCDIATSTDNSYHQQSSQSRPIDYTREEDRLRTFQQWPNAFVTPVELARAGFYFVGRDDVVRCAFCRVEGHRWVQGDNPMADHRAWQPACPFVQQQEMMRRRASQSQVSSDSVMPTFSSTTDDTLQSTNATQMERVQQRSTASNTMSASTLVLPGHDTFGNFEVMPNSMAEDDDTDIIQLLENLDHDYDINAIEFQVHHDDAAGTIGIEGVGNTLSNETVIGQEGDTSVPPHLEERLRSIAERLTIRKPYNPDYVTKEQRVASFRTWPLSMRQKPQQMANAGFYYLGTGDQVLCYYCGGGLRNFEPHDDPWEQHARWFPRCSYLLLEKGQSYVDQVHNQSRTVNLMSTRTNSLSQQPDDDEGAASSSSIDISNNAMESTVAAANAAVSAGEPDNRLEEDAEMVVARRELVHPASNTNNSISSDTKEQGCSAACALQREKSRKVIQNGCGTCSMGEGGSGSRVPSEGWETVICKICYRNDIRLVFKPCDHAMACTECGLAVDKCPICRQVILSRVRLLLS